MIIQTIITKFILIMHAGWKEVNVWLKLMWEKILHKKRQSDRYEFPKMGKQTVELK